MGQREPLLGFESHSEPFDKRLLLVAGIERLDADRELIEELGFHWFLTQVLGERLPLMKSGDLKVIITIKQAPGRDRADFNYWALWLISKLAGLGIEWEYWNEPNLEAFWHNPNAREYIQMATDLWNRLRRAGLNEHLLIGSMSTFDVKFFIAMRAYGSENVGTGYSFHAYPTANSSAEQQARAFKSYTSRAIWMTEVGILPLDAANVGETQYSWFRKMILLPLKAAGMKAIIWYRWPCGGPNDSSFENGVINPDGSPREFLKALMADSGVISDVSPS